MRVADILSLIDNGVIALPEFQRGYVWNRDQVRHLLQSLYRGHPIGSLLVWVTAAGTTAARGSEPTGYGTVELLLDGQQRITSLYGIIRGRPPTFFHGDTRAFLDLYFNVETEKFEFHLPMKMANDPTWISVTAVMQKGAVPCAMPFLTGQHPNASVYLDRLNALERVKERPIHAEKITGDDKTVEVVVDIFNEINSGGTKLSKGDLVLAKLCAARPQARNEMLVRLDGWRKQGFNFELDWLLRCITAVLTGQARFEGLSKTKPDEFVDGLRRAGELVDKLLNLISGRLGLDHDRVLAGRYALPVMCCYLEQAGGKLVSKAAQDRLLYWYVHSFMWGRYAGSTETVLNQDLAALKAGDTAYEQLVQQLNRVQFGKHSAVSLVAAPFRGEPLLTLLPAALRTTGFKLDGV